MLASATAWPERLPIESVTMAQGLASNTIHKIVRDSRGFLWFCTGEGLSRFDGHQFVNFGISQGLPGRVVWDLTQTRSGDYWAATDGGLVRLPGVRQHKAEVFYPGDDARSRTVLAVKETADGALWVGTEGGLFRMARNSGNLVRADIGPPPESWSEPAVAVLEEDGTGNLWFGGYAGIGRITKQGRVDRWTPRHGFASYVVASLFRDTDGTIWAGTEKGLCHMLANPQADARPVQQCYGRQDGLPSPYTQTILRASDGALWAGTLHGAVYAPADAIAPLRFSSVTTRQGLSDDNIEALAEDVDGNLWLGAADDGAMKLSRESIVLFNEADGLAAPNVVSMFEGQETHLYAMTRSSSDVVIHRFDGRRFLAMQPAFPPTVRALGTGLQQVALQDRFGEWWIATGDGLLRYRSGGLGALRTIPEVYVRPGGPDGANVRRLYQDSAGDVWWSTSSRIANTLGRWSHARRTMDFFSHADGLPPLQSNRPSVFVEDRNGILWMGFESQGLARRRSNGTFEYFDPAKGWPSGRMRSAYRDRQGRLWFGSSTGLWRLDDPGAAKPVFRAYAQAEGLSSLVQSVTGDAQGRIYAGTGVGVDRLDPPSGRVEHFSTSDGLPSGAIQAAYCDRGGNLWFATRHGISRFVPRPTLGRQAPPTVLITAVKVRGIERPISAAGETSLSGLTLHADEGQIEFHFAAPRFRVSNELLYQYRLEGIRSAEWSTPSEIRSVNFASLPAGSYRFLVRTADAQGSPGATLASVGFRILPPFWLRWWFQTGVGLIIAAAAYGLYRYRIDLALERERLRMRIATDLHDDIGSSLSRIAIWSEVAAQQAERDDSKLLPPLAQIGAVSREIVDSMSEIVWAVNPKHDHFTDLAIRMRRYVSDLAAGANLPISFTIQGEDRDAVVGPAARREIFLIFKEALNNVLRHAGCTECSTSLSLGSAWITLRVSDNGRGFDPKVRVMGNGLDSMVKRAERVGGTLRIESAAGRGTSLELRVPRSAHEQRDLTRSLHT
jgi:ligand-binding sensor domain-containing protein/signal transduction histidine kinase